MAMFYVKFVFFVKKTVIIENLNLFWKMHWNINVNIFCFNVSAKVLIEKAIKTIVVA